VTAPVRKPTYKTFVVERHVPAPRDAVWRHLTALLDDGIVAAARLGAEAVLSFEPPWRRAARLELTPLALVEHTVAIRDDGDSSHLVWAYIAEPPEDDDPAAEAALARLQAALTSWADAVLDCSGGA
jgi:hypothetical protein